MDRYMITISLYFYHISFVCIQHHRLSPNLFNSSNVSDFHPQPMIFVQYHWFLSNIIDWLNRFHFTVLIFIVTCRSLLPYGLLLFQIVLAGPARPANHRFVLLKMDIARGGSSQTMRDQAYFSARKAASNEMKNKQKKWSSCLCHF